MNITKEERQHILKLQATLIAIEKGDPIFFNITLYERLGLVKAHGRTIDNCTRYILTEKAKMYLRVTV